MQTNIPSNLQANIEKVRPMQDKCNTKYYVEAVTFNLRIKDNQLWNDMISANFAQVSATQTECWCKLNYQTQPKTNEGLYETKWHKVMPTMQ